MLLTEIGSDETVETAGFIVARVGAAAAVVAELAIPQTVTATAMTRSFFPDTRLRA